MSKCLLPPEPYSPPGCTLSKHGCCWTNVPAQGHNGHGCPSMSIPLSLNGDENIEVPSKSTTNHGSIDFSLENDKQ